MIVTLPNCFTARPYQSRYMRYFDDGGARAYAVWHRRAGKDLTDLHQKCKMAHERVGLYWHCLPTEEQARKSLWLGYTKAGQRIMELVFPSAIRKSPREWSPNASMIVELRCGSMVQLVGSDNIDSLVGSGPRHVTFSEFALSRPTAWPLVKPMLDENGGTASFLTTPRGRNHAHALWKLAQGNPAWFTETVDIFSSGAFPDPQAEIQKAKLEGMPDALIEQEYLCSWDAANVGSVWGDLLSLLEKQGATGPFQHDTGEEIFSSWDLGVRDSTAILLWKVNRDGKGLGVDFVDWHEAHGKPLSYFCDWLELRAEREGFKYKKHWLPHDARARTLVTGSSVQDQLMQRWPGKVTITPSLSLADGIQAGRWLLQQRIRFHPRCAGAVEALKAYSYAYDEDARTFSSKPDHSWASHTADAFRYAAIVAKYSEVITRPKPAPAPLVVGPAHRAWNLEQLHADRANYLGRRHRI